MGTITTQQQVLDHSVTAPDYQPFPVDALPVALSDYVSRVAAALPCDPAMVALPALAVCGSLVGNTRVLRLKQSWEEPCVLWTCVVADSGTGKSPALDQAVRPLHRLQKRLQQEHESTRIPEYLAALDQWRKRKEHDGATAGPEPEKPTLPRVFCSDTTVERLGELLAENPRGILCCRDELAGWFGSFARYKGKGGGSDLPNWLEMYRAGPVTIDRKTTEKKTLFIDRAAVSVCGTIQPTILAKAVQRSDFLDSGLVARLLLAMPPKIRKRWRDVDLDGQVTGDYEQLLTRLFHLEFGTNDRGEHVPVAITLGSDARKRWISFYNSFSEEQTAAEGDRAAALSKLEAYAARLTLLHHLVEHVASSRNDDAPVTADSVHAGERLTRWFANEAQRVYATFGETDEQQRVRQLMELVRKRDGQITARDLQRANGRRYPDAGAAERALDSLVQAGLGRWRTTTGGRGGRPVRTFLLHPGDA